MPAAGMVHFTTCSIVICKTLNLTEPINSGSTVEVSLKYGMEV